MEEEINMNVQEAIAYIHSMRWDRRLTGYELAKELLGKMGNPEKKLKYVHIGGTNGKGSTAAIIASILQKAGYKTGLFTSPYLFRFQERMQVNGEEIADEDLASVTEYVKTFSEQMETQPSEFALVCCIAFEYFTRQDCDIVVLEVGMGGANDATNVIDCPEVAILTNIGLDHTEYLGHTVEDIARTKAGILKENGVAVCYPNTASVEGVLKECCQQKHVEQIVVDFESLKRIKRDFRGEVFDCGERKNLVLPLLGHHQVYNAAVALSAIDVLTKKGWKISEEAVSRGMQEVRWPGRFEVLHEEPLLIVDGGHNPQCMEALAQNLHDYLSDRNVIAITGILADKACGEMFQPVLPYVSEFLCITPPSPRKMEATELAEFLHRAGGKTTACKSIKEALELAWERSGKEGAVVCFGSLYSVCEIISIFEKTIYLH